MTSQNIDFVDIQETTLSLENIISKVQSPQAGAISTFSGTTRDNFNGKKVIKLEYEAYTPMALKEMKAICDQIRAKWNVIHIALVHKIGEVPIGETSVLVAVSSAHRRDSLQAVEFGIDTIKSRVPIWKKEFYEDGSIWKDNCEACHHHNDHKH